MKKLLTIIALVVAVMFTTNSYAQTTAFKDVSPDHWAYKAIEKVVSTGLMEGYPQGTFEGKRPITRYEMAIIVARLVAKLEEIGVKLTQTGKTPSIDTSGFATKAELEALKKEIEKNGKCKGCVKEGDLKDIKSTVSKLADEFSSELQALGVRVAKLEEGQKEVEKKLGELGNVKFSGSIRFRGTRYASELGDLVKRGSSGAGTAADQWTQLVIAADAGKNTNVKLVVDDRGWGSAKGGFPVGIATYSGIGSTGDNIGLREAYVSIKPDADMTAGYGASLLENVKIKVGKQLFSFGPGLLVHDAYKEGLPAVLVTKELESIKLTGLLGGELGNDKIAAARGEFAVGEDGVVGINLLLRGAGSIRNSFGADVVFGPFFAEAAILKPAANASNEKAIVVGANYSPSEDLTLSLKGATIDDGYVNSLSNLSVEDQDGVYRSGFTGVSLSGTYNLSKAFALSGEVNKGDSSSPTGYAKVTLSRKLTDNASVSASIIQYGKKSPGKYTLLRGEMSVKF